MPDNPPVWLTTTEAAALLRLRPRTLYHYVAHNRIPHTRAGGRLLFQRAQLLAWLAARTATVQSPSSTPMLIAGSHDPLLEWAVTSSACSLEIDAQGSSDGLEKLVRRRACAALIHVPDEDGDGFNQQALNLRSQGTPVAAVRWARREQGLLVAQGNPLGLQSIGDLARPKVRIVMRQAGAGSNLLLARLLKQFDIQMRDLTVMQPNASNENEVALTVANDQADVGFGIRAAAIAGSVQFIPLVWEQVDLAFWQPSYFEPPLQLLTDFTRSDAFAAQARKFGGYDLTDCGKVSFNGLPG